MGIGGQHLRQARLRCGLTFRDVERASDAIAGAKHNAGYFLPISRLSEIENHGAQPTIHRLYTLAALYRLTFREVLGWFGVDLNALAKDQDSFEPARAAQVTRMVGVEARENIQLRQFGAHAAHLPGKSTELMEGDAPAFFPQSDCGNSAEYRYALMGQEDDMMYPLIPPGSLLQIDMRRSKVVEGDWRNEFERPIYFIAHRDGYVCSWSSLHAKTLILQPHPLSPCAPRIFLCPQEAEILGQVVGVSKSLLPVAIARRASVGPRLAAGR
jgi:hypothetical protein